MEQLKQMKEMLTGVVQGQMTHLEAVDTKELGEAIDMIKDLAEAIYYCTVTEAMEGKEKEWEKHETMYYPVMYYEGQPRDEKGRWTEGRDKGRMYYDGEGGGRSNGGGVRNYTEREMPFGDAMRDHREGRSPMSRKMYMESKEMRKDKVYQIQELEKYVQELTSDMMEMIADASPEEKQMLSNKIATLATKIK